MNTFRNRVTKYKVRLTWSKHFWVKSYQPHPGATKELRSFSKHHFPKLH